MGKLTSQLQTTLPCLVLDVTDRNRAHSHSCKVSLLRCMPTSCFAITNHHSLQSLDNSEQLLKSHIVNRYRLHTCLWASTFRVDTAPQLILGGRLQCQCWYQVTPSTRAVITVYGALANCHTLTRTCVNTAHGESSHPGSMYELPFTFSLSKRQRSHLAEWPAHCQGNLKPKLSWLDPLPCLCKCSISPINGCQPGDLKIWAWMGL